MSKQRQIKKVVKSDESGEVKNRPVDEDRAKKIKEDMDKILDEIDDILEENSEEFVKSYVQRGGE